MEQLDIQLPALEGRKSELEAAINGGSADLTNLSQELATVLETLADAEERWLELSELAP